MQRDPTFGEKVITFNRELDYDGKPLPRGIRIMNPFKEFKETLAINEQFCRLYFNDRRRRNMILGINPSRLGAGLTGIPFTDPKRLMNECGIDYHGPMAHEPSSVFVYEVIAAYGGVKAFYDDFFINSPCPLGFTSVDQNGKETNYNYYDSRPLLNAVYGFMIGSLQKFVSLGIYTDTCFCFGTGENRKHLFKMNEEYHFFGEIVPLEHPRFIMQYRYKQKTAYIDKYLAAFSAATTNR